VERIEDLEQFNRLARASSAIRSWTGAGFMSGPVRNDAGELESTWILFAPPAASGSVRADQRR
jgi:hypothetical protein